MERAQKIDPLGYLGMDSRFARSLVETAPVIILVLDTEGRILYFNPFTEKLTDYSLAELHGKDWCEHLVPAAERAPIRRLLAEVLDGKPGRGNINGVLTRDGAVLQVEWHDDLLRDADGQVLGLLSIGCDISERLECERALDEHRLSLERQVAERTAELLQANLQLKREVAARRRTEKSLARTSLQLEAILDAIPDIIGVLRPDFRVERYNRAGYEFFGLDAQAVVGRHCYGLIGRKQSCEVCPAREVLKTRKPARKEVYDAERKLWFDVRAYPVFGERGRIRYIIEHLRDVTREREVDRLKSEFISTAAHELRTPLAAVTGFSELLLVRGDLSAEEQREFLNYIHDKSWALTRIVETLLDISRAESGRQPPLNPFPCRVDELVRQVEPVLRAGCKGHSYAFELEDEDLELIVDRQRIGQVLENLVTNALKYSPAGGLISIRGRRREKDYLVEVADQGIGMTAEQAERIFDKFYRADSSSVAAPGIGLGMSIAKALVQAHGGEIWVKSTPGVGTSVFFSLPLEFRGLPLKR
ncbi:PAS domain-containing sensor histidine kinase [Geoalkalibacter halelectricus]|uniref:histidine kinase n=1 Tax=Geoalkalibacter halelectricus TaxID=2847045 RepID=A0ABY5ZQB1_9BACT|nr:ATP-binding protein [Geoalkalibacter halelectricus]MDO3378607.1 PAS domain-containing protein [Geoalkalibacter halelectricus]UWZ80080.1 PAS domain-containing protein [Geoalkalibacter halelectricus]